eukprot:scaffold503620_cov16-Prasinocladus_malaysianus.AAC.1
MIHTAFPTSSRRGSLFFAPRGPRRDDGSRRTRSEIFQIQIVPVPCNRARTEYSYLVLRQQFSAYIVTTPSCNSTGTGENPFPWVAATHKVVWRPAGLRVPLPA